MGYSGLIKIARCGFPWKKTTRRPAASPIPCSAAPIEEATCGFLGGKHACSSLAAQSSTGNPVSVYTHCETALATGLVLSFAAAVAEGRGDPGGNSHDRRRKVLHPVISDAENWSGNADCSNNLSGAIP